MKTAAALIILSLLFSTRCARHAISPVVQDPVSEDFIENLNRLYPEQCTMYHRVILTVRGKKYDFNGYLTREGKQISAIGFNDLGGRLFHITASGNKIEVLSKPSRMPATVLRDYVAPELNAIFGAPPAKAQLIRSAGDRIVLADGERTIEYIFNADLKQCNRIVISDHGERTTLIELRDYRLFSDWNRDLPRAIHLSNQKWSYEMTIRLLQIKSS